MAAAFQAIFRLAASNHSKNGKYSDGVWNSHLPTVKSSALRYKGTKDKGSAAEDDDDEEEEEEYEEEEEEDGEIDREEKIIDADDNSNLRIFRRKRKLQELPVVKGADASETKKWQSLTVNVPAQPPSIERQLLETFPLGSKRSIESLPIWTQYLPNHAVRSKVPVAQHEIQVQSERLNNQKEQP